MDTAPSLDAVYEAVFTLYHDPDPSKKEVASVWLQELQKSVFSWKVADEMLHGKRDLESCYFAAQTMRSKIQLSFHELPLEAHLSLRDSLLEHMGQVNMSTNVVIVTQLCLALSDMALQMLSWTHPVVDLIERFSTSNVWPLLEVLTVLPEEVNSRTLRLGTNRREEVRVELSNSANTVTHFLKGCLNSNLENSEQVHMRVLRCFTSWVTVRAITLSDAGNNIIIGHAFLVLVNHQSLSTLHEAATDCVCSLLQCLEDNNNQQELEQQLFANVISLEESYHLTVAHEDQEKSMNYCRIFTELGESFLGKILSSSNDQKTHFALKICDLVLICVGHHDYEVAEITFNLWFRISEELYQKNNETVTLQFKPYVERLIAALCKHCQMEPDSEGLMEEGDDFADFRSKVSELIKDVVFIVGSSNCFRQMFHNLQQPDVTWDSVEAALFIMQSVAKNILPEEKDVVPKVVEAILVLPESTHSAVRYTSVQLLGELCEWIEKHPQTLEPTLNFLLYCLQQPQLASIAAKSLQNICSACRNHMSIHYTGLLQIAQSLETFTISNDGAIGLLKGIATTIGKLPQEQIHQALRDICWCQINPLCVLVDGGIIGDRGSKTDPCVWLDRLAIIFRNVHAHLDSSYKPNPCLGVVTEILPILSTAANKYQADLRICERLCRCLRFAVRCVPGQLAAVLPTLIEQIVGLYQMYRFSCFIYLGSILVDEYASNPDCLPVLYDMLKALMTPTFEILQQANGVTNHPDTVDDFFRLCARFVQRSPVEFLCGQTITPILNCALSCIPLDHRDANSSVLKFIYDTIHSGRDNPERPNIKECQSLVDALVTEHGQTLVTTLIQASVFNLHSYMFPDVADVLDELKIYSREMYENWLMVAILALPHGNPRQATYKQVVDFHTALIRARAPRGISHAVRDFVRLYR